jgi:hypothetical protein
VSNPALRGRGLGHAAAERAFDLRHGRHCAAVELAQRAARGERRQIAADGFARRIEFRGEFIDSGAAALQHKAEHRFLAALLTWR